MTTFQKVIVGMIATIGGIHVAYLGKAYKDYKSTIDKIKVKYE